MKRIEFASHSGLYILYTFPLKIYIWDILTRFFLMENVIVEYSKIVLEEDSFDLSFQLIMEPIHRDQERMN